MAGSVLIKNAAAIVSCDDNDTVYRDSDILIEGNRIANIGRGLPGAADEVINGEGKCPDG